MGHGRSALGARIRQSSFPGVYTDWFDAGAWYPDSSPIVFSSLLSSFCRRAPQLESGGSCGSSHVLHSRSRHCDCAATVNKTESDSGRAFWIGIGSLLAAAFSLASLGLGLVMVRDVMSFVGWLICIWFLGCFMWVPFSMSIVFYPVFAAGHRSLSLAGAVVSVMCFYAGVVTAILSSGR